MSEYASVSRPARTQNSGSSLVAPDYSYPTKQLSTMFSSTCTLVEKLNHGLTRDVIREKEKWGEDAGAWVRDMLMWSGIAGTGQVRRV